MTRGFYVYKIVKQMFEQEMLLTNTIKKLKYTFYIVNCEKSS